MFCINNAKAKVCFGVNIIKNVIELYALTFAIFFKILA